MNHTEEIDVEKRLKFSQQRERSQSLKDNLAFVIPFLEIQKVHSSIYQASEAGFYFDKTIWKIMCFCCHKLYPVHYSNCAFVRMEKEAAEDKSLFPDFVPKYSNPSIFSNSLRYEKERRKTFIEWPFPDTASPTELAKDGFFFLRKRDYVCCIYCRKVFGSWQYRANIREAHLRLSPHCPFANDFPVGNVTLKDVVALQCFFQAQPTYRARRNTNTSTCLPVQSRLTAIIGDQHDVPRYRVITERLQTFVWLWPEERVGISSQELAEAGFFYSGPGDRVQCGYCGLQIRNLEHSLTSYPPLLIHGKLNPNCVFVKLHWEENIHGDYPAHTLYIESPSASAPASAPAPSPSPDSNLDFLANNLDIMKSVRVKTNYPFPLLKYVLRIHLLHNGTPYFQEQSCLEDLKKFEERNEVLRFKESSENDDDHVEGEVHNPTDLCQICFDQPISVCFFPCKHFRTCAHCTTSLKTNDCPFCRRKITESFRLRWNSNNSEETKSKRCQMCGIRQRSVCFLPCRHLTTCTYCVTKYVRNDKYPIPCPTCHLESFRNFQVMY